MNNSHYYNTIDITISGPGGTITFETLLIKQLFEALGYTVNVDDDYPLSSRKDPNVPKETEEEFVDRVLDEIAKENKSQGYINLKTKHCPWGG